MGRRLAAGLAALVALAIAPAAAAAQGLGGPLVAVGVTPTSPSPVTTVTVSFRLPAATTPVGPVGGPVRAALTMSRSDQVEVTGPAIGSDCLHSGVAAVPIAAAGTRVHVALSPAQLGGTWCAGMFRGEVVQTEEPICSGTGHRMCPLYMTLPRVIGRFHFTVAAR